MTVRRVLGDRTATTCLGGVLVSGFGDSAMMLVAGIWVKTLTGSNSLAAAVTFCVWAPTLVGPVLGTVADRVRRRPLLIWTNAGLAALLPVLLAVRTGRDVWLLFAVFTLIGAASVLADAAEAGIVTAAVPADLRGDFNGLRMTVNEAMKLLAPLAGAGLFLRFGGGAVALLDAATFVLAALAFAALRVGEQPAAPAVAGLREQTAEGIRHLRSDSLLRRLVTGGAVAMFLSGMSSAAIYAMTDSGLHRPPAFVAVLYAVQGSGSIVAGVVSGAIMRRMPERVFAATGLMLSTAGAAVRAVPSLPVCIVGTLAIGVGLPWVIVAAFTAVQQRTGPELVGRVAAAAGTVVFAPTAVAAAVGAGVVAVVDFRVQLVGVGAAGWLAAWFLLLRRPRTSVAKAKPDIRLSEPEPEPDPEPGLGSVPGRRSGSGPGPEPCSGPGPDSAPAPGTASGP